MPRFDDLFQTVATSKSTPESLVAFLSVEGMQGVQLDLHSSIFKDLVRFRHLRQDARMSAAKSYLRRVG